MDFALSEEQEMLKKMARDFLTEKCPKALVKEMERDEKGYSPELWQEMAGLGWMGLVLPEKYGGSGMGFLDLAVLLEEMGRACLPGPFLPTVVLGALPILDTGTDEQQQEFLPKIAKGESILTLALTESDASYEPASIKVRATRDGDSYLLDGIKLFVPDAHVADFLLCVARTSDQDKAEDGITTFLVNAKSPGITCTVLKTMTGDKLCEVIFNHVRVPGKNILGKLDGGWGEVEKIIERAVVAKCCEMVGNLQQVLEMTVEYAKERKQFNRPIGSFQAIQHYLANMTTDIDGARFGTYQAAWMINEGMPAAKATAIAKAWLGEICGRTITLAHQIHAAIGVTADHDLPIYTRRAKAASLAFGDAAFHRETVALQMGL